jgi:hypothetical protein
MRCLCPACNRYGMRWDARAKVLLCYYDDCRHVVRFGDIRKAPTKDEILAAMHTDGQVTLNGATREVVLLD